MNVVPELPSKITPFKAINRMNLFQRFQKKIVCGMIDFKFPFLFIGWPILPKMFKNPPPPLKLQQIPKIPLNMP